MTLTNLVTNGYFSEEMPPPFSSSLLGANVRKVLSIIKALNNTEQRKMYETESVRFSIPKVGIHRRVNGIPNPYHQIKLSQVIAKNWRKIQKEYRRSLLSASVPEVDKTRKRSIIQFAKYEEFREKCIEASFDTFFELRTDISKYFPSIYTHSIPWAMHSKAIAKTRRKDKLLIGNVIDECLRFGQSGQTKGIPIGTDTSRIVAEIIGCSIDVALCKELKREDVPIKGHRFVDDCHFFFYSQSDAEKGLKHFEKILSDLSLNINEEKTFISRAPFFFENTWNNQINSFAFRRDVRYQKLDLRNYFNLLLNLARQYPNDSVVKYGIKRLRKIKIHKENWNLFESLVYALTIAEGSILPDLLAITLQNKKLVTLKKLGSVLKSLLEQHIYKGNHFEVSWALWIARTFNLKISRQVAEMIVQSKDILSIIILLDLRSSGLVPKRLKTKEIELEFSQYGLTNEYWLLVYEAAHKGWILSTALTTIDFFKKLSDLGVSFYDNGRQIEVGESNIIVKAERKSVEPGEKAEMRQVSIY
jgi:hypothetical protein